MLESAHNASRCEQDCKEEEKCPLRNLYICTILCVCVRVCVRVCAGGGRGGSGGCKESDKSIFIFFCAQHRPEMIKKVSFSSQKKKKKKNVLRV